MSLPQQQPTRIPVHYDKTPHNLSAIEQELRANRLGSSGLAAVMELDDHSTPADQAARLLGIGPTFNGNIATHEGHAAEFLLDDLCTRHLGWTVTPCDPVVVNERWADNTDRLCDDGENTAIPVEYKKTNPSKKGVWERGGPIGYQVQTHAHIIAHDAPYGYLVGWIPGEPLYVYKIEACPIVKESILHAIDTFFETYIDQGVMPDPDASRAWKFLTDQTRSEPAKAVEATQEASELVIQYRRAAERMSEAEKEAEALKMQLKVLMADAEKLKGDNFEISYKTSKPRVKTDWQQIALELGADQSTITKHTTTAKTLTRPFRVKYT
ncbi:MAG: hypothetical protein CMF70_06845 [Magnetovibrio sp.]|nr:hypothetical protein [Magnetovibrio sp.]|tara:strand:+ start:1977 stop:2951 length:975 start_codon:yes stop_codon:yes gene_type:complete